MQEKKISLSTLFLVLAIIIIIILAFFCFKFYKDYTDTKTKLENFEKISVNEKNTTIPTNNSSITENTYTTSTTKQQGNNSSSVDDTKTTYTITTKDEIYATINATKNGKTISKEFEMNVAVAKTGTMDLPTIGSVALVATSGGEYYGVNVYQLVNDDIKLIGTIDCGADMIKDATYTVDLKDETTVIINAHGNNKTISKEFEMNAAVADKNVVDILNCGKVVLISESGGEYYGIQVYRLSQDYTTGEILGIINVGSIQYYQ